MYRQDQPLFEKHPWLWRSVQGDLIRYGGVGELRENGSISSRKGVVRLEPFLNPSLIEWTRVAAPDAALAIRLDPYFAPDEAPLLILFESILMPANPK